MAKGVVTLTEGRSGSSWLGKLCTQTGVLGVSSEWVDPRILGLSHKSVSGEEYVDKIVTAGSSENGCFALKLFPRHVHWFHLHFGFDLISSLRENHNVQIVTVERADRVQQAVSFAKAMQSSAWSSNQSESRKPRYDFEQISRCYFLIERSYNFWNSYLTLRNTAYDAFYYEDMLHDPMPFVETVARHAGIMKLPRLHSRTDDIQRNKSSNDWKVRFLADAETTDIIGTSTPSRPAKRSLVNLGRFIRGKQMKPGAFAF